MLAFVYASYILFVFPRRMLMLLMIGITFPLTVAFITDIITTKGLKRRSHTRALFGVPEWKAKFSALNNTDAAYSYQGPLPLLLLPFEPIQIPLPGQHTKLTF